MKKRLKMPPGEKMHEFIRKYKLILLIILLGIVALVFPTGNKRVEATVNPSVVDDEESFSVEDLEKKLGEILSKVDGAGEVSVMLTVRRGTERLFAVDQHRVESDDESELREEIVIVSTENGEGTVLIGRNAPVFQGALIVCPGGDDPEIVLKLTKALSGLTGLSSGRITVCKGA